MLQQIVFHHKEASYVQSNVLFRNEKNKKRTLFESISKPTLEDSDFIFFGLESIFLS